MSTERPKTVVRRESNKQIQMHILVLKYERNVETPTKKTDA